MKRTPTHETQAGAWLWMAHRSGVRVISGVGVIGEQPALPGSGSPGQGTGAFCRVDRITPGPSSLAGSLAGRVDKK